MRPTPSGDGRRAVTSTPSRSAPSPRARPAARAGGSAARRLLLVRHAETAWNVERRVQGHGGEGLSQRGRRQARVTAAYLAQIAPDAAVHTSDLQRCVEMAAPLERALGRPADPDPGLRERDFGTWTGRLVSEIERDRPDLWRRWRGGEDVIGEVGGEDTATFTRRVVTTLSRLVEQAAGTLVCITHGGTTWHGTRALLGLSDGVLGGVHNASVTELAVGRGGRLYLRAWNQTTHLPAELVDGRVRPPAGRPQPDR